MGAHILAIKDMATDLCKPYAAELLVKTLKQEVGIPIHFHTHDTAAGIQSASYLKAAEERMDIVDCAAAPMSGGTSQPNLNTVVEAARFTKRETGLVAEDIDAIAEYWQGVREFYAPFETEMVPATSDLYSHEMPGGQYTNLNQQARALGLGDRWHEVCKMYAEVNLLFGDIVKVTPTSKSVGDMALFMVANNLTPRDITDGDRELAFPESVLDLIGGRMGQPPGGFPPVVVKRIMRDKPCMQGRPGESLPPADFSKAAAEVREFMNREPTHRDVVSYLLYPKVYKEFIAHQQKYSDTSGLPTPVFFYGQQSGEELSIDIEVGKTLIIKFLTVSEPYPDGRRTVFFGIEWPATRRRGGRYLAGTRDQTKPKSRYRQPKANWRAGMPGMVVTVAVQVGDQVAKGQKLLSLEAMKMESTVYAERDGKVAQVLVKPASRVEAGDLMIAFE